MPCPLQRHIERRRMEFHSKVSPILVEGVWGPDFYLYNQVSEFVELPNKVLQERNLLVRVLDISKYPPEWKKFMNWHEESVLTPRVIVDEDVGCALNPIEISDDEDEEFVPMSDDE